MRALSQPCASRLKKMELIALTCTSPAQVSGAEHGPRSLRCSGGEEYHLRREAEDDRISSKSPGSIGTSEHHRLRADILCPCRVVFVPPCSRSSLTFITLQISTERISLSSVAYSSPTHYTISSWVPFPLSLLLPSPTSAPTSAPKPSSASPTSDSSSSLSQRDDDPARYPLYRLTLAYSHSSNANKSLLASDTLVLEKPFGEMFDEEGRLAVRIVEDWVLGTEGLGKVVREKKPNSGLLSGTTSGDEGR